MIIKFPVKSINDSEIAYSDILWFAVDRNGYVILANSLEGDIPQYVKENAGKAEFLAQELLGEPAIKHARNFCLTTDFIYYANTDSYDGKKYTRIFVPKNPVHINNLSHEIRELLSIQTLDIDSRVSQSFCVQDLA